MLVRPVVPFTSNALGYPTVLTLGDILEEDHPFVRDRPDMFVPVSPTYRIEDTSANPGEFRRGPGRPRKNP